MQPTAPRTRTAVRRTLLALVAIAVAAVAVFLPFAGEYLVVEDPVEHADALFVLAGAHADRWLEAVELYNANAAPRILLSPGHLEGAEVLLRTRGVRFPSDAERSRDAILQLGVPATGVSIVPGDFDNTAEEAAGLLPLAKGQGWHQLIVVTSKYHSRRAAFAFRREFRGSGIVILLRTSRFDSADPPHWWRHRGDVRWVGSEITKLIAYRFGLGG